MAQAFVMPSTKQWAGDQRALWVVMVDTPELALDTAYTNGCDVDGVVGTLSEENSWAPWLPDRSRSGTLVRLWASA